MFHQPLPVGYPRLEEEFHLRLERERQQREYAEAEALRRAARLEERRKGLELAREAAETAVMTAEDARSAIAVRSTPQFQLAFMEVKLAKRTDTCCTLRWCVPKTRPADHDLATDPFLVFFVFFVFSPRRTNNRGDVHGHACKLLRASR